MTYPIKQIHASYNPLEDRVLLTVETHNQQIYLGWITRRFVTLLLPTLHGQHPITKASMFEDAPQKMKPPQIKQSQNTESKSAPEYPLGESPLLFSKISFSALRTEEAVFILSPNTGQGIKLPFTPILLNLMLKNLKAPLEQSDWGIEHEGIYGVPMNNLLQ
ncbi:hypothetical protein MNBD_GAMMA04-683 [hydrothermal vent metagenome]|uniref:Uncharacterized protein n=1 Tax=hydrothermal vent metagenome TaxID=652676 RepID=A0A3B0WKT7_9ZZZZ